MLSSFNNKPFLRSSDLFIKPKTSPPFVANPNLPNNIVPNEIALSLTFERNSEGFATSFTPWLSEKGFLPDTVAQP
eukprot:scaffold24593_cov176-Cylindrotheca_fusiformis.AAC.4